jgi:hypothetical protein
MTLKTTLASTVAFLACSYGIALWAQGPVVNIDPHHHGQLASAQDSIVKAYQAIGRAQKANDDQLGGHAQRAKDFLIQADEELRLAADVSNDNRR